MTPDQYSTDYMAQGDCHDCGIPYGSPRFPDLVVPHDQWAKISPSGDENGLLCPNCMCARAESAGVECRAIFRSGPFFDAHPVHQPAPDAVAEAWQPTHQHVKRGTEYRHIGTARIQSDVPLADYDLVEVYQAEDGDLWARATGEFFDGRFRVLASQMASKE